jgi:hypothetical protein
MFFTLKSSLSRLIVVLFFHTKVYFGQPHFFVCIFLYCIFFLIRFTFLWLIFVFFY